LQGSFSWGDSPCHTDPNLELLLNDAVEVYGYQIETLLHLFMEVYAPWMFNQNLSGCAGQLLSKIMIRQKHITKARGETFIPVQHMHNGDGISCVLRDLIASHRKLLYFFHLLASFFLQMTEGGWAG
jgi:hypothetical protein